MCINCHRSSISLLVAALTIGKGAEYQPPEGHSAEDQAVIAESMKLALGDVTRLIELTIFNHVDERSGGFEITAEAAEVLASFFAMLSNDRLWWLAKVLGQFRAQLDVTEDVAIEALKERDSAEGFNAILVAFMGGEAPIGVKLN